MKQTTVYNICIKNFKVNWYTAMFSTGANFNFLGPIVHSVVSSTSSLRGQLVKCFTTLLPNTVIFFVEKIREAFALQKLLTFFSKKYWHIWDINVPNLNETLTNDVVSFEQPGPLCFPWRSNPNSPRNVCFRTDPLHWMSVGWLFWA